MLGFRGGQGGDSRGGGGYGGESFLYLVTGNNGKGGDISGVSWTVNINGIGGGGADDSPGQFCFICIPIINRLLTLNNIHYQEIINHKLTIIINLQVAKEVLEDIMPEEEGLTQRPILMTVQAEGEEVDIFPVAGEGEVEQAVMMEGEEEPHLLL